MVCLLGLARLHPQARCQLTPESEAANEVRTGTATGSTRRTTNVRNKSLIITGISVVAIAAFGIAAFATG
jgi:hypothetical protein